MTGPRLRHTSLERRRAAAETVAKHLDELRTVLHADDPDVEIVDGSAVAVELRLTDADTCCYAVRVSVFVAPAARPHVERTLMRAGFEPTTPSGDGALLRLARRHGRRPVHVLFETTPPRPDDPHPSSRAAARTRAERMAGAWREAASTFRRLRHDAERSREVTKSFEVQLIERRRSRSASHRAAPDGHAMDREY